MRKLVATIACGALAALSPMTARSQTGGSRVSVEELTLDPAIQAMLAQDAETERRAAATAASEDTPAGRAAGRAASTRRWSSRTAAPPAMRSVEDAQVRRGGTSIPVRVYRPNAPGVLPIIVYYHGGGWFIGGIEASDRSSRQLADDARAIVVSVDYRLSPEAVYPAAWNDAENAYDWVVGEAARLGGAPDGVCVGGDSAGGNLAIAVTSRRSRAGKSAPACQILYYPAVDNRDVDTMRATYRSSRQFGEGFALDRAFTDFILPRVFPGQPLDQPEISPLFDAGRRMPPTLIAIASFDPLRDSQRAYAARLIAAGTDVDFVEYPALIHGFLQHTAVTPAAVRASRNTARAAGKIARRAIATRRADGNAAGE